MEELVRRVLGDRIAVVAVTDRRDGDLHPERVAPTELRRRQRLLTGTTWIMLDEVHGTTVVSADDADDAGGEDATLAEPGDVLVAQRSETVLAIWAADCAPIALFGADASTRVLAHAGWRGLADGVLDAAVDAVEAAGTAVALAVLGPCIHPCCYEFGHDDLDRVAAGVGAPSGGVGATTSWGTAALDVPGAVRSGLARRGITLEVVGGCTGCDARFYSHRCRADAGRHAMLGWFEDAS